MGKEKRKSISITGDQAIELFAKLLGNKASVEEVEEDIADEIDGGLTKAEEASGVNTEDGGGDGVYFDPIGNETFELLQSMQGVSLEELSSTMFPAITMHVQTGVEKGKKGAKPVAKYELNRHIAPDEMPTFIYQLMHLLAGDNLRTDRMLQLTFVDGKFIDVSWSENNPYKHPDDVRRVYFIKRKKLESGNMADLYLIGLELLLKLVYQSLRVHQRAKMGCGIKPAAHTKATYDAHMHHVTHFAANSGSSYHAHMRGFDSRKSDLSHMQRSPHMHFSGHNPTLVFSSNPTHSKMDRAKFNDKLNEMNLEDERRLMMAAVDEVIAQEGSTSPKECYVDSNVIIQPPPSVVGAAEDYAAPMQATQKPLQLEGISENTHATAYVYGNNDVKGELIVIEENPEEIAEQDEAVEMDVARQVADLAIVENAEEEAEAEEKPAFYLLIVIPTIVMTQRDDKGQRYRIVNLKSGIGDHGTPILASIDAVGHPVYNIV